MNPATLAFWLNVAALCSGMAGTALIYFFGAPRQVDTGGVQSIITEVVDQREVGRINRFRRLGNTGLVLVFLAFLLQLVALLITG